MHAQQAAPGEAAVRQGGEGRPARGARALRRRRGCLHRRSRLHPPVRLSVAFGQAHRRSAQGRSGGGDRQFLRRLRQLRRSGGSGGALPLVLPRRYRPQSDAARALRGAPARRGDRLPAAAARAPPHRLPRAGGAAMNMMARAPDLETVRPICIAVLAMGGQGGGVLVDWIVALAERGGYVAQSTSVPGVAQRTGATVYYVEMIEARPDGRAPVLALMPAPGHVDIVNGAELMEAGRAMQRGLVSPERTTLIASSHRSYAVAEKIAPGDGIADDAKVYRAAQVAAKRFLAFDMAALAERTGSAISAVLFGALAASGTLPFPRAAYEAT